MWGRKTPCLRTTERKKERKRESCQLGAVWVHVEHPAWQHLQPSHLLTVYLGCHLLTDCGQEQLLQQGSLWGQVRVSSWCGAEAGGEEQRPVRGS